MVRAEIQNDLGTLLAAIGDSFIAVDNDWNCAFVNNKAATLAGRAWPEMIGRSFWDFFSDLVGSDGRSLLNEALEQHKATRFDCFVQGRNQWFDHRVYPADSGLALFSVDITSKKQEELRLLEMQQRVFAIWTHAPVGISETSPDGRYLRVNRKWCEITGYEIEELLERTFAEITHPDDIEKDTSNYRKLINREIRAYDLEKRYVRKDGSVFWVQIHRSLAVPPEGEPFCIGVAEDITARKAAEEELQKAQEKLKSHADELELRVSERTAELEKSNKAMESFVYTIAHDLRSPVRAMQGLTQVLEEDYGMQLNSVGRDYTARIHKASQRLDSLIKDLLVFGQLTHVKLPTEPIDLVPLIQRVLARFSGQIANTKAEVEIVEPLFQVGGNTVVLKQIFSNLISNALTFVQPGIAPRVRIWAEKKGSTVRISVQDNGIGIHPQYHDRIFRLFETLHAAGSYPGTGIGLALVRQGAERLGGRVGVDSKEGEGSRFWVELPAAPVPGETAGGQCR